MFRRIIALIVCVAFISTNLHYSYAQGYDMRPLPVPGQMVAPSTEYVPLTLKGLVLHPDNALKFDFLMDTGHTQLQGEALKAEALKVMTYFLTALTMPEEDMWVNLSPYEKDKMIENNFRNTLMGRDLLAEDYILKQLTASLIYPEKDLGGKFWKEVYEKLNAAGIKDVPVETFNKVWIVPSQAVVWEHDGKVMIVKSHLRVMLEEDFLALKNQVKDRSQNSQHKLASQTVRDIILPVLEKQVNEGEHFTQLRQMYQAIILATWYKKALKDSIIAKVYADKGKIKGVDISNTAEIDAIYQQYLEAFKKGAFNYIKEDVDAATGEMIPRKYFSGGFSLKMGIISLATALSIWSGTPTPAQAAEIAQVSRPVGTTILVQGSAAEVDIKGRPIILAQANGPLNTVSATSEHNKERVKALIEKLKSDPFWWNRVSAARELGIIGDSNVVPILIEMLEEDNPHIRDSAIEALGKIGDKSAVPLLIKMFKNSSDFGDSRKLSVEALGKIGDRRAVLSLIESLNDATHLIYYDQVYVVNALGNIRDNRAVSILIKKLKSPYQEVRIAAAKALGEIGDSFAIPALNDALDITDFVYHREVSESLQMLNANMWQRIPDTLQWWIILGASLGLFTGMVRINSFIKSSERKINRIRRLAKRNDIQAIKEYLYLRDDSYSNSQEDVRMEATKQLSDLITDAEGMFQMGEVQINNPNQDVKIWAINLLVKSRDRRAIELIAEVLEIQLKFNVDYELYNAASDALFVFKDVRSEFKYIYHNANISQVEEVSGGYWTGRYIEVINRDEYWEKVSRSDGVKGQASITKPIQDNWPANDLTKSQEVNRRVEDALNSGTVDTSQITDSRLLKFLDFLKQNNLTEIVLVGGAVRDAVSGEQVRDFDITVKLPLADEERGAFRPLTRETFEKAEAILARLANALSVTVDEIKNESNPVTFEGIPIQYLGPGISKGSKAVVINTQIVDEINGEVQAGFTGPEILFMGMDAGGQLYGYNQPLENWMKGRIALKGDLQEGRNMDPLTVLRILRLRHQFGLVFSDVAEKLMRKVMKESKPVEGKSALLKENITAVIDNAIDKVKARQELKDWGFEIPDSPSSESLTRGDKLIGIVSLASVLALGSAVPTDVQAAGILDIHQYLSGPLGLLAFSGFIFGVFYGSYQWITRSERLIQRKLIAISKYFQENKPEPIIDLLDDKDSRVRSAAQESLSKLSLDSETQYRLGAEQILKGDSYNKKWAISMLEKSKDRRAIEPLAKILTFQLIEDTDYQLYNDASDALKSFSDDRSAYIYQFFPEEGHEIEHVMTADEAETANSYYGSGGQAPYGAGSVLGTDWVVDKPSYWEKVNRPTQISGKPEELGGIALDSRMMDLQIKRDGNGVPLPVSQQPLDQINLQGFVPQIINIQTINLIQFLGLNLQEDQVLAKI